MKRPQENLNTKEFFDQIMDEWFYDCNPALLWILWSWSEWEKLKNTIKKLKNFLSWEHEDWESIYDIYYDIIKIYSDNWYKSTIDDAMNYCKEKFEDDYEKELEKQTDEFNDDESNPYNDPEYRWRNDNWYSAAMNNLEQQAAFIASSDLSLPDGIDLPEILKTAIKEVTYYDIAQKYWLAR